MVPVIYRETLIACLRWSGSKDSVKYINDSTYDANFMEKWWVGWVFAFLPEQKG